jgi:hypothetical protein
MALALMDPEQAEADEEIDHLSRDEPDPIERKRQSAIAECAEYFDLVAMVNNQPRPECPGCETRAFAERDLVAEATIAELTARLSRRHRAEQIEELPL